MPRTATHTTCLAGELEAGIVIRHDGKLKKVAEVKRLNSIVTLRLRNVKGPKRESLIHRMPETKVRIHAS